MSTGLTLRYRYRLRVSDSQAQALNRMFSINRFVWNHFLGRWNDLWDHEGIRYTLADMSAELTDLRNTEEFEWLRASPREPQQETIRSLDAAIRAFYSGKRSRPTYRSKRQPCTSASWSSSKFGLDDRLHVQSALGRLNIRVVWSRPLPSTPKTVTVMRDTTGRWYASFVVRIEPQERVQTERTTGVDVGLTTFATTTDPEFDIANPRFARGGAKRLAAAQRRLARTTPGSKRNSRARLAVAAEYQRQANRRRDHHHKTARRIAREFDVIGVEDLRVANMIRNRHLARSISDAGWAEWVQILEHQARKAGSKVIRMDARNTTQTCSGCGTKAKVTLGLKDRQFCCTECGLVADRDRNAAWNLDPGRDRPGERVDGSKTSGPNGNAGGPSAVIPSGSVQVKGCSQHLTEDE